MEDRSGIRPMTWVRIAIWVAVLAVLAVFVIQNSGEVTVDFLIAEMHTRLIWALLLAAVLGFLLGLFRPRVRGR